ncbi:START domain-containing protein, partial [Halorubrum tibetense]
MTTSSIRTLVARMFGLAFLAVALSACSTVSKDWQLQKQQGALKYYTRMGPTDSLPEFRATVDVDAPVDKVMNFIMDFSRHAEWVHGCELSRILAMDDFSTAYIYQVTKLPVVSGRDMIMLAEIVRDEQTKQVAINLSAEPSYCDNN